MSDSKTILSTQNLAIGYKNKRTHKVVLSNLDLTLKTGELTCLLGPNGSGKSTLLRTIGGVQKPLGGEMRLGSVLLESVNSKELARMLSLVLTDRSAPGNLTGYALVSLGRFPYSSWMGNLDEKDEAQIHWAMDATGTTEFANTHVGELSDGEKQKVMIARALAQDTPIIFLDEPTAHLDLPNRIEIFHLLRELAVTSGKAILLSSHEMDMALTNADRLWLVTPEQTIITGVPEDLVINGSLEKSFARETLTFDYAVGSFKKESGVNRKGVYIQGPDILVKWTRNALERYGYGITTKETASIKINVSGELNSPEWRIDNQQITYKTIEQLLKEI